ncbi:hypothetical protein ACQJBY_019016 [Aegilops geniculata]
MARMDRISFLVSKHLLLYPLQRTGICASNNKARSESVGFTVAAFLHKGPCAFWYSTRTPSLISDGKTIRWKIYMEASASSAQPCLCPGRAKSPRRRTTCLRR